MKNIDQQKLKKVVVSMEAKARELGWSPSNSAENVQQSIREPKFVYVRLSEV